MPSITVNRLTGSERTTFSDEDSRSSADGVRIQSPLSSVGRSLSSSIESEGWTHLDEDDIDPSESASRPPKASTVSSRHHSISRSASRAEPRPEIGRRESSRRPPIREEEAQHLSRSHRSHSRAHSERDGYREHRHRRPHGSRRAPSDESAGSVDSHDYDRGYAPHPHDLPYRPQRSSTWDHQYGSLPPSMSRSSHSYGASNPFGGPNTALVSIRPPHDPWAYAPAPEPFSPPSMHHSNPFASPLSAAPSSSGYFSHDPHAPPMPHSHSHRPMGPPRPQSFVSTSSALYGSDMMAPSYYSQQYPPSHYMYPPPPPSHHGHPPAAGRDYKDDEIAKMQAMIESFERDKIARETAALAKIESDRLAAQAKLVKELEDKKRAEELTAATVKAKEAAELAADEKAKKAKEESDKAIADAKKKAEDLEKKKKDLEDEVKKHKGEPDDKKAPIKFKDAVGRTFSFPWRLCKTWKGMEALIRQAFLHVDGVGHHVMEGHYDLLGPQGVIILPQVWDTMIQPDWEVSMHMWPLPEPQRMMDPSTMGLVMDPTTGMYMETGRGGKHSKSSSKNAKAIKTDKKKHRHSTVMIPEGPMVFGGAPMPPPLAGPGASMMQPGPSPPPPPPPMHHGHPIDPMGSGEGIMPMPMSMPMSMPMHSEAAHVVGGAPIGVTVVNDDRRGGSKVKASSSAKVKRKSEMPFLAAWISGTGGRSKSSGSKSSR